jgi:hypothetical protein
LLYILCVSITNELVESTVLELATAVSNIVIVGLVDAMALENILFILIFSIIGEEFCIPCSARELFIVVTL